MGRRSCRYSRTNFSVFKSKVWKRRRHALDRRCLILSTSDIVSELLIKLWPMIHPVDLMLFAVLLLRMLVEVRLLENFFLSILLVLKELRIHKVIIDKGVLKEPKSIRVSLHLKSVFVLLT